MTTYSSTDKFSSLTKRRSQLSDRLKKIKSDLGSGLDRDSEEQAMQLENYDVLLEIERVTCEELGKVDQQIARTKQNADP